MDGWWIWATGVGKTVARKDLTEAIGWTTHSISHYPFFIIMVRLSLLLLAIAQENRGRRRPESGASFITGPGMSGPIYSGIWPVTASEKLAQETYRLRFRAEPIAAAIKACDLD